MPMKGNLLKPKDVADAIGRYFKRTSAKKVVRRAEELKPPPGNEPLGMLSEGGKSMDSSDLEALRGYMFPELRK